MESDRKKVWTIPRVQGAVKAVFLAQGVRERKDEFDVELRYRDLKSSLSISEGPVSDRTLSRALAGLVESGHVKKSGTGKKTRYRIKIPRSDLIAAYAKSDGTSIAIASRIGAVGQLDGGWAFYGVPEPLANRLRPALRSEAELFRQRVSEVVGRFADGVIRKIVQQAGGRLPRRAIKEGAEGLQQVLQRSVVMSMIYFGGGRFWDWIEQTHPGALKLVRKLGGIETITPGGEVSVEQLTKALAFLTGFSEEEIRPRIEREARVIARHAQAANRLLDALPPSKRERARRELAYLSPLGGALTAVVHHL